MGLPFEEDEAERLALHLSSCNQCRQVAKTLKGQGSPVVTVVAQPPDQVQSANELIDQLSGSSPSQDSLKSVTMPHAIASPCKASDPPQSPRTSISLPHQIGRYVILKQLGSGGMGTVYQAEDPQLRRIVALKVPHLVAPHFNETTRFLREARAAGKIQHRHICPVYDVGEHNGIPFVVMAYVEGHSLAEYLSGRRRYEDVRKATELVGQVAEALAVVHEHGIIHRDLKPGNVLIDTDGRAILTDFGLARLVDDSVRLTADGVVMGTPAYMAPEQAAGEMDRLGPCTDLYSLGVVLYEMLTGCVPFQGPMLAVLHKIVYEPVPPPTHYRADLDPALVAIVMKAISRRPEDRYQTAHDFVQVLNDWSLTDKPASNATPPLLSNDKAASTIDRYNTPSKQVDWIRGHDTTKRRQYLAITALVTLMIAMVLMIGFFDTNLSWKAPQSQESSTLSNDPDARRTETIRRVRELIDERRFQQALTLLDQSGNDLEDQGQALRVETEACQNRLELQLAETTSLLIKEERYCAALEIIAKEGSELKDRGRSLASEVRSLWLTDVMLAYHRKDTSKAENLSRGYRDQFPKDINFLKLVAHLSATSTKMNKTKYEELLSKARAQAADPLADNQIGAIQTYADLFTQLNRRQIATDTTPEDLCRSVLEPAIQLGSQLMIQNDRSALKKALAELYAARGRLIRDNPASAWPFKDATHEVLSSYSNAIKLYPSQPEYYLARAYALSHQPQMNLDEIKRDLDKADQLNMDSAESYGLKGSILHMQARSELTPHIRLEKIHLAIQAYNKAIDLGTQSPEKTDLATLLTNRCGAYLELSNYVRTREDKTKYLDMAQQDAEQALVSNPRFPVYALATLGNVQEDMAWLLGQHEKYESAIKVFTQAINDRPDLAMNWLNRGRCLSKRVIYGGRDPTTLSSAINDLTEAVRLSSRSLGEAAQASYWLGQAHLYRKEYNNGDKAFQRATDLAEQGKSVDWAFYMKAWAEAELQAASNLLDKPTQALLYLSSSRAHAQRLSQSAFAETVPKLMLTSLNLEAQIILAEANVQVRKKESPTESLIRLRKTADQIRPYDVAEAARLKGSSYLLEGQVAEAVKAYDEIASELVKPDAFFSVVRRSQIDLLLEYVDFLLAAAWQNDLRKVANKPNATEIVKLADRAIVLANTNPSVANDELRAIAYGRSGRAWAEVSASVDLNEEKRAQYNAYALRQLREAIQLAPKYQSGWVWRVLYARVLKSSHHADPKWESSFRLAGLIMLHDARKMAPEAMWKQIDGLITNY